MLGFLLTVSTVAAPFDYHSIRGRKAAPAREGRLEGEFHLRLIGKSRVQEMARYGPHWSGNAHLLWDGVIGDTMQTSFRIANAGRYRISMQPTLAADYGLFSAALNGKKIKEIDFFGRRVSLGNPIEFGEHQLKSGEQKLTFELIGANPLARKFRGKGYLLGIDYLTVERLDKPAEEKVMSEEKQGVVEFAEAQQVLSKYCFRCHGKRKLKGKINLQVLDDRSKLLASIDLTRNASEALARHEMPPEDEEQPTDEERRLLGTYLRGVIDEYLRNNSTAAPVVMRRMNRYEYNNAVRDLLGLNGDIYPLPEKPVRGIGGYFRPSSGRFPDSVRVGNRALGKFQIERQILTGVVPFAVDLQAEHGFNNRGDQLSFSPILMENFLQIGQSVVNSPEFDKYLKPGNRIFVDPGDSSERLKTAEATLRALLHRAFRQPVEESTVMRYLGFFARELNAIGSYGQAMKNTVAGIIASPRFIYIMESESDEEDAPLSAHELATRLALFLWSSIPDQRLLDLANSGELLNPTNLRAEIARMLGDPRSQALSQNFARQWLRLDQLIAATPDFERFEIYYSRIGCEQWKFGLQMMIEPLLLFESIMVEDRSIMLLVDANYTFRSDELQSWYNDRTPFSGKENRNRFNTNQQTYRRRKVPSRREGGVITSAAVLTMTSAPLRTSPIQRGAWVAGVILNQPPPPPPDVVPEIEADDAAIEAKGMTLRQALVAHQVNESCRSCHSKIDPLGFALEQYDPIGRWRENYRSGLPINASGKFAGHEFTDVIGLKDMLLNQPELFMRAFSEHLLAYALGRELELTDKPGIDRITRNVLAEHGRFSTVVTQVATSYPFLHKSRNHERP